MSVISITKMHTCISCIRAAVFTIIHQPLHSNFSLITERWRIIFYLIINISPIISSWKNELRISSVQHSLPFFPWLHWRLHRPLLARPSIALLFYWLGALCSCTNRQRRVTVPAGMTDPEPLDYCSQSKGGPYMEHRLSPGTPLCPAWSNSTNKWKTET